MTATALPAASPSPASTRAARIIAAWLQWRADRVARPKLGTVVDAVIFGALLATWVIGYALVCPAEPARHHAAQRVAEAR